MNLHRRYRLPLAFAVVSLLSVLWIWQMTLPLLAEQVQALNARRTELAQRQQAAQAEIYQPLIARLQQPLPAPALVIAALRKTGDAFGLSETNYSLAQALPLEESTVPLAVRRLNITLSQTDAATGLQFWQELRQALPCEVHLIGFNSEGPATRLEVELIGTAS